MARHCPECGFVVSEGANYCPKCGAFQGTHEPTRDDVTTATYIIDEATGELRPVDVGDVAAESGALVRRSGDWYLDDSGSLNGTYVNRRRIDSHRLEDGDELQVGKYKLTYLAR